MLVGWQKDWKRCVVDLFSAWSSIAYLTVSTEECRPVIVSEHGWQHDERRVPRTVQFVARRPWHSPSWYEEVGAHKIPL
eukprot:12884789-Prorocentrum_lima.AAC.1